ncbi:MAG TPA: penicillin-binding protein 2 [Gemmatimonadaceae bacterium]|nr:penicillin-binding protein 2 [Gemmatimonadaceae bacterium]
MKFHPNDVQRRSRGAAAALFLTFVFLVGSFFRAQVLQHAAYVAKAEGNRLREVPLPAPRGMIKDRTGAILAENVPGYSVSIIVSRADSLRAVLGRIATVTPLPDGQVEAIVQRFRRNLNRPTVILPSATFDVVSRLEEHRTLFPGLIVQEAPRRYYPDGAAVAAVVGYTGEVTEEELASSAYAGYAPGDQVGKSGLEREYESRLKGSEGVRFVEVDARGRVVRDADSTSTVLPEPAPPLVTNIDLDLQRYMAGIFGDSLRGAAVAVDPATGGVLALHSAPIYDPNRFIGGVSSAYYKSLLDDPRLPLLNKATQGRYPPGSTWKLATAITALEMGVVKMDEHMPVPCRGGLTVGNRVFKCHLAAGHGDLTLGQAIEQSCDVYFYQLAQRIGLQGLVAGGLKLGSGGKSGIDLPSDNRPLYPSDPAADYFTRRYGPRGWNQSNALNLAIGQGENSQTVVNVAKFYTALAENGAAATPRVVNGTPDTRQIFDLDSTTLAALRTALMGVVSRGTAQSARINGVVMAGKTGTAQTGVFRGGVEQNHAWFAGFAPADVPRIVVVVMLEFGGHGPRAAHIASKIMEHYLKVTPLQFIKTEGD